MPKILQQTVRYPCLTLCMKDELRAIIGPILLLIAVFAGLLFVALQQPPDPGAAVLQMSARRTFAMPAIARMPQYDRKTDVALRSLRPRIIIR